jgi:hypothetical protein
MLNRLASYVARLGGRVSVLEESCEYHRKCLRTTLLIFDAQRKRIEALENKLAALTQLAESRTCNAEVAGSSPAGGSKIDTDEAGWAYRPLCMCSKCQRFRQAHPDFIQPSKTTYGSLA